MSREGFQPKSRDLVMCLVPLKVDGGQPARWGVLLGVVHLAYDDGRLELGFGPLVHDPADKDERFWREEESGFTVRPSLEVFECPADHEARKRRALELLSRAPALT